MALGDPQGPHVPPEDPLHVGRPVAGDRSPRPDRLELLADQLLAGEAAADDVIAGGIRTESMM
jgi:hypothetical protein